MARARPGCGERDRQRARVYAWEDREIAPRNPGTIGYAQAQPMVDAIWAELGLAHPPAVSRIPRQARRLLADASRLSIRLPAAIPSWCLLHEIAHALSSTHDGRTDGHGPIFMGLYLQLLVRYLRLPKAALLHSLAADRIAVDPDAVPSFAD